MTSEIHRGNRPVRPELSDELLSAYIDDQLTPAERTRVESVLARSPVDRENLELMQQTVTLLHELPRVALPRAFTLSEAQVGIRRAERRTWNIFALLRTATVATAMMFSVLWAGGYYLRTTTPTAAPLAAPAAMQSAEMADATAPPDAASGGDQLTTEAQRASDLADAGESGQETPTEQGFTMMAAPTEPSTVQQPDPAARLFPQPIDGRGGGTGMGGGGGSDAPAPGMGGEMAPSSPGGEFSPGGEPIPAIVPLPDETPEPAQSTATPQDAPATETPAATEPAPEQQVALAPQPAAQPTADVAAPPLPEADTGPLARLRTLRQRWEQPFRVAEVALGALFVSLLAATLIVGRRHH